MASVHDLHPEQRAAPGTPASQVMAALEQMAKSLIGEQLRAMFDSADDVLFEMADRSKHGDEKRKFLDTMRAVRLERPRILDAFQKALHDALRRTDETATPVEVDLDDLEKWTLQESSDLEEKIAVSNMDSKAASMHAKELRELEQRLARLADDSHGAVSAKALCPARILDAFRLSMKGLDVELPIKLVIYKLFDRVVVSNMGQVFAGANQMLEQQGVRPKTDARAPKKPAPWKPVAPPTPALFQEMAGGLHSGALAEALRPYLGGALGAFGAPAAATGGPVGVVATAAANVAAQQNAQLADEMLAVLEAAGHGKPVDTWMPTQNLALVSRMFDDFYADPQLPDRGRSVLRRLQFPVMKFAMSDPTFFANPQHPVRSLVHDVYDNLMGAPLQQPGADFHRLEELIQDLLQRFEPDPAQLRQRAREMHPVTVDEAERFLEQQRGRLEQQRKALQEKIRRIVAQELRLHLGERRLPKPVMPLILSGFGPILVAHYRAGGQDHPGWKATLALLDRVVACVDAATSAAPDRAAAEAAVIEDVHQCLASAAFPAERIEKLADPLATVFEELAAAAPMKIETAAPASATEPATAPAAPASAAPAPAAAVAAPAPVSAAEQEQAVQLLLRGGDWFRVWCAENSNCRWLKLDHYYLGADTVVFEDFGGENRLKMSATAFVHDLVSGRSAPVDPDPALQRMIQRLPPAPAIRVESRASWYKAAVAAAA